jgi:hypothetical protein
MDSILTSIKKLLGIEEDYIQFDPDIIIFINSALMSLNQLNVGPETGYAITDSSQTWESFIGDRQDIEAIKTYVYLKTRIMFDPPANAFVIEAFERQIKEFEWRLLIQTDATTA